MDQPDKSYVPPTAIVFNKVGWMDHYGSEALDPASKGADEAQEGAVSDDAIPEDAAEVANFLPDKKGKCHGLIQTKTLSMGRLGAQNGERFMFGTVASVAQHPDLGPVIVGWQPHAELMMRRRVNKETGKEYNYRAPAELAVVLPVEERTFVIPQGVGGMGKSAMVYSVDAKGKVLPWAQEAAEMMNAYENPDE